MPARSGWGLPTLLPSSRIFTGTRCTTFTQLPVAFSGGSSEKREPVPALIESTLPSKTTPGNVSTRTAAFGPGRRAAHLGHALARLLGAQHARGHLGLGLLDLFLDGGQPPARRLELRLGAFQRGHRVVVLAAGDVVVLHELLHAVEVALGLAVIAFRGRHVGAAGRRPRPPGLESRAHLVHPRLAGLGALQRGPVPGPAAPAEDADGHEPGQPDDGAAVLHHGSRIALA